eukprot:5134328-Prymnesium_polylepis.1
MGPLARADVYDRGDGDSRENVFDHLREMVFRGIEPAISPKSGLKHTVAPNSPPSPPALFCWS